MPIAGDKTAAVGRAEIVAGLDALGLRGRPAVVHASLRSFGHVTGGAPAVVEALLECCPTVLAPAFISDAHTAPPPHDRPAQNGCDYSFYDTWKGPSRPFDVAAARINPRMGAVALALAGRSDVRRSDHPWYSWAACGAGADALVGDHPWDTTNLPLEKLGRAGGGVVLMGVGLSSCTAVHLAEERAGRRPFIRWAIYRDGSVRRIRVGGCAKGFDRLYPRVQAIFRETRIGSARVLTVPLEALVERATAVIRAEPELTRCSESCLRCRDAILGGPVESPAGCTAG